VRERLREAETELVRWSRVARLATVGGGELHVVPVSPVLDGDRLVFASDAGSAKVRNIRADPRVAIVFDDYAEDWTALRQVFVRGRAQVVDAGVEWSRLRELLYQKYLQYEEQAPLEEGDSVMVVVTVTGVSSDGVGEG
jgi:PPOX class probable F420-dependent enzyme